MNTVEAKVDELDGEALNYAVFMALGHRGRLCLEAGTFTGYRDWQAYEQAWGFPVRDYSSSWELSGPLLDAHCVSLRMTGTHTWRADDEDWWGLGDTPLVAICRLVVKKICGPTIHIPVEILKECG